MLNYLQEGHAVTLAASPYDVESGRGVLVNKLFGIAANDALSGEECVVYTTGCYALDKVAGESFAAGADVYYSTSVFAATSSPTGATRIGVAIKDAAAADLTVEVRLSGAW